LWCNRAKGRKVGGFAAHAFNRQVRWRDYS
jgi:hypothetical protein